MKHFKLFASAIMLSTLSLIATTNIANAAPTSASQTLECTLGQFVNISPANDESSLKANINVDTGDLDKSLTSVFNVQLNSAQTLYLTASAKSSTTDVKAFFRNQNGDVCVTLAHTGAEAPTLESINAAQGNNPVATTNPNVIAYKVTGVEILGASAGTTPLFKNTEKHYEISAVAGESQAKTTISPTAVAGTYSFVDTAGVYQAIVTLTTSAT